MIDRINKIISFLTNILFDSKKHKKIDDKQNNDVRNSILKSSVALLSLLFLGLPFIYYTNYFFKNTDQRILNNAFSYEIKPGELATKYRIGTSPMCGDYECWLLPSVNDSDWREAYFPKEILKNLEGYRLAKNNYIYYRIKLKIPRNLYNSKHIIAFTPSYIRHNKYQFYSGGIYRFSGEIEKYPRSVVIPISRSEIDPVSLEVLITIKGTLMNSLDSGLWHRGSWFVGPESQISKIHVHEERAGNSFYLVFIIAKGSLIALFAIVYIFTMGQKGFISFLIYAFFSMIESLLISSSLIPHDLFTIRTKIQLTFYSKVVSTIALFSFLMNFYNIKKVRTIVPIFGLILVFIIASILHIPSVNKYFKLLDILAVSNIMLLIVLGSTSIIAILAIRLWKKSNIENKRVYPLIQMLLAVSTYLLFVLWTSFYSGEYKGFDIRPIGDLGFLLFIAFQTIHRLGSKEKNELVLQDQMIIKEEMEQDFKDATAIATLFNQPSVPKNWMCEISTYNNQYSGIGGDLYKFKTTPGQPLEFFLLCDVTGHSIQGSLVAEAIDSVYRAFEEWSIGDRRNEGKRFITDLLSLLNRILIQQGSGSRTTTALVMAFDKTQNKLYHLSCGHPNPISIKQDGNGFLAKPLVSSQNNLGRNSDMKFDLKTHELEKGEIILAFTDGLLLSDGLFKKRNTRVLNTYYVEKLQGYFHKSDFSSYSSNFIQLLKDLEKSKDLSLIDENDDITLISFRMK